VLLALSTALEQNDPARFLAQFDPEHCRDYPALQDNVVALLAQYEVASSVALLAETRDGDGYDLKLDWLLHLRPAAGGPASQRRRALRCRIHRRGRNWKVTALEPASFFAAVEPK